MKTSANKTAPAASAASTASTETDSEARVRNQRRAERAQKIAKMQQAGHPFASAALAQHLKVNALEDQLASERGMLMGILKHVK